jgi:hypothetical protein
MTRQRIGFESGAQRLVFLSELGHTSLQRGRPVTAVTMAVNTMTARQSANPVECFIYKIAPSFGMIQTGVYRPGLR